MENCKWFRLHGNSIAISSRDWPLTSKCYEFLTRTTAHTNFFFGPKEFVLPVLDCIFLSRHLSPDQNRMQMQRSQVTRSANRRGPECKCRGQRYAEQTLYTDYLGSQSSMATHGHTDRQTDGQSGSYSCAPAHAGGATKKKIYQLRNKDSL